MMAATLKHDGRSKELRHYYARRQAGDHLQRIWTSAETRRLFGEILRETGDSGEASFARMVRNEAQRLGVT